MAPLGAPITFAVVDADPPASRRTPRTAAVLATELRSAELERSALGAAAYLNDLDGRLRFLQRAIDESPRSDSALVRQVRALQTKLLDVQERLNGDPTRAKRRRKRSRLSSTLFARRSRAFWPRSVNFLTST